MTSNKIVPTFPDTISLNDFHPLKWCDPFFRISGNHVLTDEKTSIANYKLLYQISTKYKYLTRRANWMTLVRGHEKPCKKLVSEGAYSLVPKERHVRKESNGSTLRL